MLKRTLRAIWQPHIASLSSLPIVLATVVSTIFGQDLPPLVAVERQPLAANLVRLVEALEYLGHPLPKELSNQIRAGAKNATDALSLQRLVDEQVFVVMEVNPELRAKVKRGPAGVSLQQGGYQPFVIKLINQATVTRELRISSPQAGPDYSGASLGSLQRQAQTELADNENVNRDRRFLALAIFNQPPMAAQLSGLEVEYLIGLIYSSESGKREATLQFDLGQGTQDLGFRSEIPILFNIRPAIPVRLHIVDSNGIPTTAKLIIRDQHGSVYPPQARRLAPDFFFQPQIYRADGEILNLPLGEFEVTSSRGPEYIETKQKLVVEKDVENQLDVQLQRWIDPMHDGFYVGDHHIHGAGCAHYENPTLGVTPADMFAQVKGEGLNVGCVLTWGPCFEHQRHYFSPIANSASEPLTLLKYDLEISGFGSAALGHVCLLNLNNQTYPGSEGTKIKGWPTWTVPVMRWAKEQGGVTGYPHSALHVDPKQAAQWTLAMLDENHDQRLSEAEAARGLLATGFTDADRSRDDQLDESELTLANDQAADQLPNLALPALDGGGAMEIFVSVAEGVCDFISAMDTARIPEWNTWYHLMNCGFPLKLSGETDFPCMSSRCVGQGRVYVQLGKTKQIDFVRWCRQLAAGESYVSDGYAHALEFEVNGTSSRTANVAISKASKVEVKATVAFAKVQPRSVAYGSILPARGKRMIGDTVNTHVDRETGETNGGTRRVEVVVNGQVRAFADVPADGEKHELHWSIPIEHSSWLAIRQFPQLHTNPINVIVDDQPIRASRSSAIWCLESTKLLWRNRSKRIAEAERTEARAAYERAIQRYAQIANECPDDGSRFVSLALPEAVR